MLFVFFHPWFKHYIMRWHSNVWRTINLRCGYYVKIKEIDHFTVVYLVTCPNDAGEAGGDLALIQISVLFLFKYQIVRIRTACFTQQKQWGLYQNKVTCSFAAGLWTDNCKMFYSISISCWYCVVGLEAVDATFK